MKRRLIPLDRPLIVLDTGAAQNIAHDADKGSPEPSWIGTFEGMRLADAWNVSDKKKALRERSHSQLNLALSQQREGLIAPDKDVRNDLQIRWLWRQFVDLRSPRTATTRNRPRRGTTGSTSTYILRIQRGCNERTTLRDTC